MAKKVLLLTVGTGNVDQLRDTLFRPLMKSIRQGEWERILLLPSSVTRHHATVLKTALKDMPIELHPLPNPGDEDDADACYGHFDRRLADLAAGGVPPERIVADFTRGTKAMSAALVLAAVRRGVPWIRYIYGQQRDERGMVVPGTEQVGEFRTRRIEESRLLADARSLLIQGNFAAVSRLLGPIDGEFSGLWTPEHRAARAQIRRLAEFCAAWDRLDYSTAAKAKPIDPDALPRDWLPLAPTQRVRAWVADLADSSADVRSKRGRKLLVDLLANARRRVRDLHLEDALIRGYRIVDLLCQIRLHDRFPNLRVTGMGHFELIDEVSRVRDPLATQLRSISTSGLISTERRNRSVLMHGFKAMSQSDVVPLKELLDKIEHLLRRDRSESTTDLKIAEWLDFARVRE